MTVDVLIIHAFSIENSGGNPAGVVLHADELSSIQMQRIAKEVGYPETAFVSRSSLADFKLDFFTPTKQIPHCGHATIATFNYLKQTGVITKNNSSKETVDGIRHILFKREFAFMEQRKPRMSLVPEEEVSILKSLHLTPQALIPGKSPIIVNTGNSFLIVPIIDEKTLATINPDRDAVSEISRRHDVIGFYPYTPLNSVTIATTRMFAPFYGIEEEAATGMAAGTLASYLYSETKLQNTELRIEQGRFLKPPSVSLLYVDLLTNGRDVEKLYVGGDSFVRKKIRVAI
jgi:PhzF family phenazine biosynthesis protein